MRKPEPTAPRSRCSGMPSIFKSGVWPGLSRRKSSSSSSSSIGLLACTRREVVISTIVGAFFSTRSAKLGSSAVLPARLTVTNVRNVRSIVNACLWLLNFIIAFYLLAENSMNSSIFQTMMNTLYVLTLAQW